MIKHGIFLDAIFVKSVFERPTIIQYIDMKLCDYEEKHYICKTSVVASAGETDRDLAVTQFPRNCVPYNIIEF